jgi:Predicted AAA-ATPase/PD-(D/E)XK nuclease superfamily
MKRKILPIGRQSFRDLREDNCVYVDKTEHIYKLCTEGKMYFLSRPRRFGKSLLLSTLKELFLGSRELFNDTWILDKWDWSKKHPIIHISFLSVSYETLGLEQGIREYLLDLYKMHGLDAEGKIDIKALFLNLVKKLYDQHGKVVILIDEYDKPIIDHLETHAIEKAKANQEVLGLFYGALKDADEYIRLLFITGISKFTTASIFSKLNSLNDITTDFNYAQMLGYTQQELENNFELYIEEALQTFSHYSRQELLEKIRLWYNGYSWDGKNTLYNPFGILLFLSGRDFQAYWFQSGTPSFLAKKMLTESFFDADKVEANMSFLDQYSLDNIELTSLMFQTGYLTIKEKHEDGELILSYPNQEVRRAMYSFLMDNMAPIQGGSGTSVLHLKRAFLSHDLPKVETILKALFANLSYDVYMHQTQEQVEGFYHGLIHILFKCLGLYVKSEVHTVKGRADSVVETPTHIYILEFKINSDAQTAFQQILDKKYALPYAADERIKVGIGINFNSTSHELDGWKEDVLS